MPKVWFRTKSGDQSGFSVVEIILAVTIFGFLVTAMSGAFIYGRSSTANSGDRDRANFLAEEGIEAIRNIRDAAFANVPTVDGTYYLGQSGNVWTIGSTPETIIDGLYTRTVTIATQAIPPTTNRKNVTVNVSWTNAGKTRQATATTRLSNWSALTPGPIMMVYTKAAQTPYYRIWNGTSWGAEGTASAAGNTINYVVLKSARTRNEAVLGMQDSAGNTYVQTWDGSTWSAATNLGASASTASRSFDIAYERNTDRALIVYNLSSATADFSYRTWNGTTLSGATSVTTPPTTGAVRWIELDQNPLAASNDIAMIMLDANSDVYGMRWTGAAWNNLGTGTTWDTTATTSPTKKGIDVEYEQTSGEALFMWGDATATDQYYRTWNGTTLSAATLLDIAAEGGVAEWLQLASRPSSNQIMLGVQDAGGDLNTRVWSGSAWDAAATHPEHDATTENITSRNFDIVWETHSSNPGKAWIVWGDQATVTQRAWASGAWGTASTFPLSDDTSFVRLRADATSGAVFALFSDSTTSTTPGEIEEFRQTAGGPAWGSAAGNIWSGASVAEPIHFRMDISTP